MRPALFAALLALPPLPGVVDRVEGSWAVVEWPERRLSDLPLALFDEPVAEGNAVRLWALPHPRGTWRLGPSQTLEASSDDPASPALSIPAPSGARADRRYLVLLAVEPASDDAGRRALARGAGGIPQPRKRMRP